MEPMPLPGAAQAPSVSTPTDLGDAPFEFFLSARAEGDCGK